MAERTPVIEPFEVGAGLAEKFKFHLFELAHAENKVTGRYFVTDRLADRTYADRPFFTGRPLNIRVN